MCEISRLRGMMDELEIQRAEHSRQAEICQGAARECEAHGDVPEAAVWTRRAHRQTGLARAAQEGLARLDGQLRAAEEFPEDDVSGMRLVPAALQVG